VTTRPRPSVDELLDSLRIGDHLLLSRLWLRAVVGLLLLHVHAVVGSVRRTGGARQREQRPAAIHLVVANPVRHGAVLAASAVAAARAHGVPLRVLADGRLADPDLPVDVGFPSVAVRSVPTAARLRRLVRAWRQVARVRTWPEELRSLPSPYRVYLLLAQSLRYDHALTTGPATAVVTDFDRAAYVRPLLWAARTRGTTTATLVHGTPSAATYLPLVAERVLAWGSVQARFFAEHAPEAHVTVIGRPDLEPLSPQRRGPSRLVLCHSMEDLSATEVARLGALVAWAREDGTRVVLRPHPRDPGLRSGRGWAGLATSADEISLGPGRLADLLGPDDLVVVATSTSAVDALALGVRTVVAADPGRALSSDLAAIRDHGLRDGTEATGAEETAAEASLRRQDVVVAVSEEAGALLGAALRTLHTSGSPQ
jgi:hypothetical protein